MTATGWTLGYIDNLTLDDVNPLLRYWKTRPPAHVILAAVYGKRPQQQPHFGSDVSESDLLASGIMRLKKKPEQNG